jgi:predicted dehydrogenase
MIRLAVSGASQATCDELERRLRQATIAARREQCRRSAPAVFDALIVLDAGRCEMQAIDEVLASRNHVLLAADASVSADDIAGLASTAQRCGVQLGIANLERHLPSRQLIRQQLDGGKLGAAGLLRLHRWVSSAVSPLTSTPTQIPTPLLLDLDVATWLIGAWPELVYAVERRANASDMASGRLIQVHLGFADGGMALVDFASHLPPGAGYSSLSLIGSAGAAYADDHQNQQLLFQGGPAQALHAEEGVRALVDVVQQFVDALQTGGDVFTTLIRWQSMLKTAEAVRQSIELQQAVRVEWH